MKFWQVKTSTVVADLPTACTYMTLPCPGVGSLFHILTVDGKRVVSPGCWLYRLTGVASEEVRMLGVDLRTLTNIYIYIYMYLIVILISVLPLVGFAN